MKGKNKRIFNRAYVTPFIALVFVVVALSGLLMFFHLLDGYTEVVHEILGLAFVLFASLHIFINWASLRTHFKKNVFFPAAVAVLVISVMIVVAQMGYPTVDSLIVNRVVQSPITDVFRMLNVDYEKTVQSLADHGISMENAETLEDIWLNNDVSPEEVIDLIFQ